MWTVVGCYATLFVLLRIPAVQGYVAEAASNALSDKLGTQVQIGKVDIRLFNRVIADDVLIYDQQQKQMLHASRASAAIELLPLLHSEIRLSSAQLFGMKADIYRKDASSPLNCQFALDSLSSHDATDRTPLNLSIASLIIRNGSVSFNQHDQPKRNGCFSPYHINADKISSHIILYSLTDDSIHVHLKRLSLREASGLHIDNLSAEVRHTPNSLNLSDLALSMPETSLDVPSLDVTYATNGKKLVSITFDGTARAERISPADFAPLLPQEIVQALPPLQCDMAARGNEKQATASLSIVSKPSNDLTVRLKADASNLTSNPTGQIDAEDVHLSESLLAALQNAFDLPEAVSRTGGLDSHGTFHILGNQRYTAKSQISTPLAGSVTIEGETNDRDIMARIEADTINIAQLLDDPRFGSLKCALDVKASKGSDIAAMAKGSIKEMTYNGYTYHDILIDGEYDNGKVSGSISIDDPNIMLTAECKGTLGRRKSISATMGVSAFCPRALNISDTFGDCIFALNTTADISGTSIEDALGSITVDDITITSRDSLKGNARIENITLTADQAEGRKRIVELQSDFANATLLGSNSDFDIEARIKSLDIVRYLFNVPVEITKPVYINGFVCTKGTGTDLTLNAPGIKTGNLEFQSTKVRVLPQEDGLGGWLYSSFEIGDSLWTIQSDSISYQGSRLTLNGLRVGNENQHVTLNGTVSAAATDSLVAELHNINVDYVLGIVDFHSVDFAGNASGKAIAHAVLGDMKAEGNIEVKNFMFEGGHLGTLSIDAEYSNAARQIGLSAIADYPEEDSKIYINGFISPQDKGLDLDIATQNTYLELLQTYCGSFLSDIDLHGTGRLRLHGPFNAIDLTGNMTVRGGCTLSSTNCRYTMSAIKASLMENGIFFNNAQIMDRFGNAAFLTGGLYHKHFKHFSYDLNARTDKMLAYDFPNLDGNSFCGYALINGTIGVQGRGNELTINADATPLRDSYMVYDASMPDAIASQDFITWGSISDTTRTASGKSAEAQDYDIINSGNSRTNIRMNFMINTTPEARLHLLMDAATGDYVDLFGSGVLRVSYYNKGALEIFGNYLVERGTYKMTIQNLLRRDFAFQRGSTISFGGDPYNAVLRMKAAYMLNSVSLADLNIGTSFKSNNVPVNCLMNITGTPAKPLVTFDLDLPSLSTDARQMVYSVINSQEEMNQQVLYLLGIGRFYSQTNDDAERSTSQSSLAMQSFLSGTLTQQFNNVLSDMLGSRNWSIGANITPGTDGFNNAEYEGLLSGRLLNNRLVFNGQFGYRDNVMTNSQSFIGDFTLQYLLTPNGNLSLKVYNQSNDRYFTRNSLNTQGIGIVLQKEFGK